MPPGLPRRAGRQRAADPGSHRRSTGISQGRLWVVEMTGFVRDLQSRRAEPRSHRQRGRARRHEPRRHDGQADGVRGRPDPAARGEGARSRRARRRAGQPLVHARHERRPAGRHARSWSRTPTACCDGQRRGQRQQPALGARQLDAHLRQRRVPPAQGRQVRGASRRCRAASGARRRTTPAASTGTRTNRRCTWIWCRRRTSRATRRCCARAAATNRCETSTNELNTVWPVRPNPGTNRAYQAGIDRADGSLARFTAVCAPAVYRGDRLPAELYGNAFVAEPAANFVSRIVLSDDGTTIRARKAYENAEFLASTDERFRPVYLSNAPDGALYVVDMYRGIIQDRASTTVYLRDHILSRKLDAPVGLGRIYRVVHETHEARHREPVRQRDAGAAGRGAVASERLAARHGAAAAGRARRQVGRAGAGRSSPRARPMRATQPARAVDARRPRRDRAGDGRRKALSDGSRDVRVVGDPHRRTLARRRRTIRFRRRC